MIYDYNHYKRTPKTVKTKTIREYEYDDEGHVIKETVTIEETRYEDGGWSQPYIWSAGSNDINYPNHLRQTFQK